MNNFPICSSLILLMFIACNGYGQGNRTVPDTATYGYLEHTINALKYTDPANTKLFADNYLKKALQDQDTLAVLRAYQYQNELLSNDTVYVGRLDSLIRITSLQPSKNFPAYAYHYKGVFFQEKQQNDLALKYHLLAMETAGKYNNMELALYSKNRIALLYRRNGDYNKAKQIDLEIFNLYKNEPNATKYSRYISTLIGLHITYMHLQKYDSAAYFNRLAYEHCVRTKNDYAIKYVIFRQGVIEYRKENYRVAIDSILTAIPYLEQRVAYKDISVAYSYLAMSYHKTNNIPEFLTYSKKMDSISAERKITHNLQREHYYLLMGYYKEKKDLKNQLKYINRFMYIDSILTKRKVTLSNTLFEQISIPELTKEKQRVIRELEGSLSYANTIKYSLYGVTGLALLFIGYQYRRRKLLKKRFEAILHSNEEATVQNPENNKNLEGLNLPKEVVVSVLKGLAAFEKNNGFTNPKLSQKLLAKKLKTNANYLSKIINHYKGVGFSSYINELRINYVLKLLEADPVVRRYSIKAIAHETGYTNPKSFSLLFYQKTGLKPSYYIRLLEKQKI